MDGPLDQGLGRFQETTEEGVAPQPEKMGTKAGSFCDFYFKLFQQEV